MNYYKLKKDKKDKEFFYDHSGYFNFWDKLLILRDKQYATKECAGLLLINRTQQDYHNRISEKSKIIYIYHI